MSTQRRFDHRGEGFHAWIGTLAVDAIMWRDYPIVQAVVLFSTFVFVGVNSLVDMLYAWLDPRIRYR